MIKSSPVDACPVMLSDCDFAFMPFVEGFLSSEDSSHSSTSTQSFPFVVFDLENQDPNHPLLLSSAEAALSALPIVDFAGGALAAGFDVGTDFATPCVTPVLL